MKQGKHSNFKFFVVGLIVILMFVFLFLFETYKTTNTTTTTRVANIGERANEGQESQIEEGEVIVKYVNEEGTEIAESESQKGAIGTEYETQRKSIAHYISDGYEPINKIGYYKAENTVVTYKYKLVSDSVEIENDNNNITIKVENTKQNKEYKLKLEQESVDGIKLTGGKFALYDLGNNNEPISGTTINGQLTLGVISVNNDNDDDLVIMENKEPEGYEKALKAKGAGIRLDRTYNLSTEMYELEASAQDKEIEVEKNDENEEIVIKVKNDLVKTYDLAVKKFASSINGEETVRQIQAQVNIEGTIEYIETEKKLEVIDGDKVIYTIRVYNEGNQPMEGKTITEELPKGLKFLPDSKTNVENGWKEENEKLTTNKLVGKTISGINPSTDTQVDYQEVKLEVEVVENEALDNTELTNTSSIVVDEKEEDKNNNSDTETVYLLGKKPEKSFDLSMKKFLYSVDEEVLKDREIVAKNIRGKIEYSQNSEIYEVSNNQKLVYTLRVFNEGEGQTSGREVFEELPDGLEFIQDSTINKQNNWKMYKKDKAGNLVETNEVTEAKVLKSDKLTTTDILGFDANNNEIPNYQDVQVEVVVKEDNVKTEDRVLTNVASVETTKLEKDDDNDKSEEKVKVKIFDLNVVKYIKEIVIKDNNGENTTKIGLENKGKIFKKEVDKKNVDNTQVIVTYGLRVKNIGEIAGYAAELTDYVPQNFELVNNNNDWQLNGKIVTTKALENKLINPGEYKTVEVTFKWNLKGSTLGERNNIAIISKYKNDYNAKDKTPDKDNEEKFIISLRTGNFEICISIILIILAVITCALYIKIAHKKQGDKI